MKKKKFLSLFFAVAAAICAYAQDCNCESNFVWVKHTFEQNDAGFQYVIDKKGRTEYEKISSLTAEKVKSAKNNSDCTEIINQWLHFFRKGHIGVSILKKDAPKDNNNVENQQNTVQSFPDWETVDIDTLEFRKYLDNKKDCDFEGIWFDGVNKIGVKHIDSQFVGFIINSQLKEWQTGQIKFRIFPDSAVFYANDHSAKSVNRAYMFSKNIIFFDEFAFFIRKYPEYEDKFLISTFGNLQPYFETLNNKTCYLRVPSFSKEFCPIIDSVIDSNKQTITKTENLIIDLRSNGGGSTNCWQNIIPYIYTNPYRAKNNIYLSTELNNINYQKNYGNNPFFDKLNKNLGKFVKDWEDYTDIKFDTIYKYPQNVAIIVDERCASATEQFLLTARQSRKVKIFGKITAGALDFSNMNTVNSPCEDFVLSYATSKDVDIDNYPIEGIGIQPDFYLDNAIQEYKWVDYVNEILNGE